MPENVLQESIKDKDDIVATLVKKVDFLLASIETKKKKKKMKRSDTESDTEEETRETKRQKTLFAKKISKQASIKRKRETEKETEETFEAALKAWQADKREAEYGCVGCGHSFARLRGLRRHTIGETGRQPNCDQYPNWTIGAPVADHIGPAKPGVKPTSTRRATRGATVRSRTSVGADSETADATLNVEKTGQSNPKVIGPAKKKAILPSFAEDAQTATVDELEYEVEKITGKKKIDGVLNYRVRFEEMFIPVQLLTCPIKIEEFEKDNADNWIE